MEYIERYLHQVGKLLPAKDKEEVTNELRELLEDEVNEQVPVSPDLADPENKKYQLKVLKKFGSPASIATKYGGGYSPLIASEQMPSFIRVLIVLGIIYSTLYVGVFLIRGGDFSYDTLFDHFGSFINNGLINFAIVVIIFFFISRGELSGKGEWQPSELPALPGRAEIKQWELFSSIAFSSFALVWLTFFPDFVGFPASVNGETRFISIEARFMERFLPFLILIFVGRVSLDVAILSRKRWTLGFRVADIIIGLLGIALANAILIFGPTFTTSEPNSELVTVLLVFDKLLYGIAVVIIIGLSVGVLRQGYRIFRSLQALK